MVGEIGVRRAVTAELGPDRPLKPTIIFALSP